MRMKLHLGELGKTLSLALPITAGHLSQMALGLADTLMIGRVGVLPLAAAAFSNTIAHSVLVIGIGLLTSVSVLVSHAHGAGQEREAAEVLRRGLVIGLGAGTLMFLGLWAAFPVLGYLGQPQEVVAASRTYLWLLALSMPFALGCICLRNFTEAQNLPWPAFWLGLFSVVLNIFLNWVLIYGNLGAPALGLEGAGVATLLSRIVNLVLLVAWIRVDRRICGSLPAQWLAPIPLRSISAMLSLGFPVAMQLLMEVGAFGAATLIMGWLGVVELAAHQIALTCAATTFMVPLGISLAVAIRVGHALGAGQKQRARGIGFGAIGFGALLSGLFAAGFILFNLPLAGLFNSDGATVKLAAQLIVVAGIFQFFDATQVLSIGALRGCKDVRVPTLIVFCAYWVVAIPGGSLLAFGLELGAVGVWLGLAMGLASASAGLAWRFGRVTRLPAPLAPVR
jgi:MATE family multidrug resistance protein